MEGLISEGLAPSSGFLAFRGTAGRCGLCDSDEGAAYVGGNLLSAAICMHFDGFLEKLLQCSSDYLQYAVCG